MTVGNGDAPRELEILVVDDEDEFRETLCEALEDAGHSLREASDGAAALNLIRTQRVDVVVTDIQMPKLDGLGLFARLKQEFPDVEVILMTSHGDIAQAVT